MASELTARPERYASTAFQIAFMSATIGLAPFLGFFTFFTSILGFIAGAVGLCAAIDENAPIVRPLMGSVASLCSMLVSLASVGAWTLVLMWVLQWMGVLAIVGIILMAVLAIVAFVVAFSIIGTEKRR